MAFSTRSLAAGAALMLVFGLGSSAVAPPRSSAERGVRLALIRLNGLLGRRDPAIRARGRGEIETLMTELFARPETLSFNWREVDVSVRGDVAWIHAEGHLVTRDPEGKETRRPYRLAGVLEPHGNRWQWRLFQGTVMAEPAQAA